MKLEQISQREIVDSSTGGVTTMETSKVFSQKISEDSFYMTFVDFISPFYKLKSDNARKILVWMCEHAEVNTGKIKLTTAERKQMASDIAISINTVTNNLKTLKDAKLISGGEGNFTVNPQIFWKGDLKLRRELLKNKEIILKFGISE